MIGFFDSGFGGLTILKEVARELPEFSYIYLGDNVRAPYGSLSDDIIFEYTREGVSELFRRGASLVVLACNTSSAVALRKIQQEFLPKYYPDGCVLGIIIPTVEEILDFECVGVFATEATVLSGAYLIEGKKMNPGINIIQQACPLLVPMIESGECGELKITVKKYVEELFAKNENIEAVILGCTHYAIIENIFREFIPAGVKIISQGKIVAAKLKIYLEKHNERANSIDRRGGCLFLTTKNSPSVQNLARLFYGSKIDVEICVIKKCMSHLR